MPRLPTTAAAFAAAAVAAAALSILALAVMTAGGVWSEGPGPQVLVDVAVGLTCPLVAVLAIGRGTLTAGARQLAVVLAAAGLFAAAAAATTSLALTAEQATTGARMAAQLQSFLWVPGFMPLLTLVPLLYPDGLLPGRSWRWAAGSALVGIAGFTVGLALYPETFEGAVPLTKPVTAHGPAVVLSLVGAALLVVSGVAGLLALGLRLRRSDPLGRRQVGVLFAASLVLVVVTVAQPVIPAPVDVLLQAAAVALVPVAIGVAITRHRLYDLDLAVCRALAGGSLAVCLVGAYLTVFAVLQFLTDNRSVTSSAVAAGVAGVVLQPLGKRLYDAVDRLYFGHRADPYAVTSRLADRLSAERADVADVPSVVCEALVADLRLRGVALLLETADGEVEAARAGELGEQAERLALRHRGEVVAWLVVAPRAGERVLDERDAAVLRGVADQVAPAVAALTLTRQLQQSREQLVAAREDERLRLRHELHDGVGATLAGLRLQVETAQDLVRDEAAAGLLTAAVSGVAHAVAEVRSLTEGLRPPGIDELGLPRALEALVDRTSGPGLQVGADVDESLAADPAVEVALYRIAAEALANVTRHASASHATLLARAGSPLLLEVRDDGVGVTPGASGGIGISSMRQRAEEVGGRVEVLDARLGEHGRGTLVRAVLPTRVGGPT